MTVSVSWVFSNEKWTSKWAVLKKKKNQIVACGVEGDINKREDAC